jgi:branched-chain amino acid transport system permease protein
MQLIVQQLINSLSIGAVYALIALGYTMVYGVLRLINFAHGDVYMVGAVIAYYVATAMQRTAAPLWLTLSLVFLSAIVGCSLLGFLIEFLAYRPLRARPRLISLITAIGVSLLLENLMQQPILFGPTPQNFPQLIENVTVIQFHVAGSAVPVSISRFDLIGWSVSLVLMLVLTWIVLRTRVGLAIRAVSFRVDTASLMGINTNRIISFTFMLGSGLAAVAGVLDAMRYQQVDPLMGLMQGLKAFIAAVLGGIGSIPGAVLGGFLLGLIETILKGVILPSAYTGYADAVAFLVLILILLVRPSGLLGKTTAEKV